MADVSELRVRLTADAGGLKAALVDVQAQVSRTASSFSTLTGAITPLNQGVELLKNTFSALVGIGERIADAFRAPIAAAAEQDVQLSKLEATLKTTDQLTAEYSKNLGDLADAQALVKNVQDDVVLSAERTLIAFGAQREEIPKLIDAVIDLSTKTGDVSSAAFLVGKALQGETASLSRFGIFVDDTASATEKLDDALAQIQARFGGQAAAAAATFSGRLGIVGIAFQQLQERIGQIITQNPVVLASLSGIAQGFTNAKAAIEEFIGPIDEAVSGLTALVTVNVASFLEGFAEASKDTFPILSAAVAAFAKGLRDSNTAALQAKVNLAGVSQTVAEGARGAERFTGIMEEVGPAGERSFRTIGAAIGQTAKSLQTLTDILTGADTQLAPLETIGNKIGAKLKEQLPLVKDTLINFGLDVGGSMAAVIGDKIAEAIRAVHVKVAITDLVEVTFFGLGEALAGFGKIVHNLVVGSEAEAAEIPVSLLPPDTTATDSAIAESRAKATAPLELPPVKIPPIEVPDDLLPTLTLPPVIVPPIQIPAAELPQLLLPPIQVPPIEIPPAPPLPKLVLSPIEVPPIVIPPVTPPQITLPPVIVPPVVVPVPDLPQLTLAPVIVPPVVIPTPDLPQFTLPPILVPPVVVPPPELPRLTLPPVVVPAIVIPEPPLPQLTLPPVIVPPVVVEPPATLPQFMLPPVIVPPIEVPPPDVVPVITLPPVVVPPIIVPEPDLPELTLPAITVPPIVVEPPVLPQLVLPPISVAPPIIPDPILPRLTLPPIQVPPIIIPEPDLPELTLPPIVVPPITLPLTELPQLTLPPVIVPPIVIPPADLPVLTLPPVEVPPIVVPIPDLPELTLPPITVPPIVVPPASLPSLTLPPIAVPPIVIPEPDLPELTLPPIQVPPIEVPPPELPDLTLPPISVPPLVLTADPAEALSAIAAVRAEATEPIVIPLAVEVPTIPALELPPLPALTLPAIAVPPITVPPLPPIAVTVDDTAALAAIDDVREQVSEPIVMTLEVPPPVVPPVEIPPLELPELTLPPISVPPIVIPTPDVPEVSVPIDADLARLTRAIRSIPDPVATRTLLFNVKMTGSPTLDASDYLQTYLPSLLAALPGHAPTVTLPVVIPPVELPDVTLPEVKLPPIAVPPINLTADATAANATIDQTRADAQTPLKTTLDIDTTAADTKAQGFFSRLLSGMTEVATRVAQLPVLLVPRVAPAAASPTATVAAPTAPRAAAEQEAINRRVNAALTAQLESQKAINQEVARGVALDEKRATLNQRLAEAEGKAAANISQEIARFRELNPDIKIKFSADTTEAKAQGDVLITDFNALHPKIPLAFDTTTQAKPALDQFLASAEELGKLKPTVEMRANTEGLKAADDAVKLLQASVTEPTALVIDTTESQGGLSVMQSTVDDVKADAQKGFRFTGNISDVTEKLGIIESDISAGVDPITIRAEAKQAQTVIDTLREAIKSISNPKVQAEMTLKADKAQAELDRLTGQIKEPVEKPVSLDLSRAFGQVGDLQKAIQDALGITGQINLARGGGQITGNAASRDEIANIVAQAQATTAQAIKSGDVAALQRIASDLKDFLKSFGTFQGASTAPTGVTRDVTALLDAIRRALPIFGGAPLGFGAAGGGIGLSAVQQAVVDAEAARRDQQDKANSLIQAGTESSKATLAQTRQSDAVSASLLRDANTTAKSGVQATRDVATLLAAQNAKLDKLIAVMSQNAAATTSLQSAFARGVGPTTVTPIENTVRRTTGTNFTLTSSFTR